MRYTIGIDTGGTYTDSVLIEPEKSGAGCVVKKAKAITTHHNLENGIRQSLLNLGLDGGEKDKVEKVVLSTTLATNAIVENNIDKVGLILIGEPPRGQLASDLVQIVEGSINIKGRILSNIKKEEVRAAALSMVKEAGAIAISCPYSTRNPALEQDARRAVRETFDIPVICGHELARNLGYLERTNTAVINAGLLPVIDRFTKAIQTVLEELEIEAPVFVVRADGSIATLEAVREKPVDTVLSGPAASMVGTIRLTGVKNAVIADMGGTTTDSGVVNDSRVQLSKEGAVVDRWKLWIPSAKLYTFGLGGDSEIRFEDDGVRVGPRRVLPACRGGNNITPTDLVHYTNDYICWDKNASVRMIDSEALKRGCTGQELVERAETKIADMIYEGCIRHYEENDLPVCAIGAPADTWYNKAKKHYDFDLIVPENYEVANAVGAAVSGIEERSDAIVRSGEDGKGFLVHSDRERVFSGNRPDALRRAIELVNMLAQEKISAQGLLVADVRTEAEDVYAGKDGLVTISLKIDDNGTFEFENDLFQELVFIETRVSAVACGKVFDRY